MKHLILLNKIIVLFSCLLTIAGCSVPGDTQKPEPIHQEPEPIIISLTISASKNLNPDIENRASPVVLRIYQLTHIDTFKNSDFFALYENDKIILNKDLKYRKELEIKPGIISKQPLIIGPNSKYIAVLAAFRDLDKAQWKSILPLDTLNPQPLQIELGAFTIKVSTN